MRTLAFSAIWLFLAGCATTPAVPLSDAAWYLVLGLALCAYSIYREVHLRQRRWVTADGEILSSEVVYTGTEWLPQIRYRYVVNGRVHESTRIREFEIGKRILRWPAKRDVRVFPSGAKVKVYIAPEDPTFSVLQPLGTRRRFGDLVVGVIAAGYGAWTLIG